MTVKLGVHELHQLQRKWGKRLARSCNAINKLLEEVGEVYPDATLYLDGTQNLHLISGPSHGPMDGFSADCHSHQERILCTATLKSAGGDW